MFMRLLKHVWVMLVVFGPFGKAHAFLHGCSYGSPPALIPPPYATLYCRAHITAYDLLHGDHLHQATIVGAASGQSQMLVIGGRTTVFTYTPSMTFATHWVRRGPNMPVGVYIISSEWTGLKLGQIYSGPWEHQYEQILGPP
jgi:hypothetical protein